MKRDQDKTKRQLINELEVLRNSEVRFNSLVEHTTEAIFCYEYDPPIPTNLPIEQQLQLFYDGVLVECNNVAARSYGAMHPQEVIGKKLTDLFGTISSSLDDFFRAFILNGYLAVNLEGTEILDDGTKRFYLNNGHGVIEEDMLTRVWGTFHDITERKKVEEALRESEERYRMLIQNASEAIVVAQDGMLKFANNKAIDITGYSEKELTSKPFDELIHPEDREMVVERHIQRLRGQELPSVYPFRIVTKDGGVRWVEINVAVIDWQRSKATLNFLPDITERKRMEEELREAQQKWMSLTENTNDFILIVDDKGGIQYINKAIPPHTIDQVIGKTLYDFAKPEHHRTIRQSVRRVFKRREQVSYQSSVEHTIGTLWFETVVIPIVKEGKATSAMLFNKDITERKQIENALRDSEEKLRRMFESINDGVTVTDLNGVIIDANDRALQLYGVNSKSELVGRSAFETIATHDQERAVADMQELIKQGTTGTREYTLTRVDGSRYQAEISASILRGDAGNPIGFVSIIRDITERRKAEEEVRKFKTVADNANYGVALSDLDGTFSYVNQYFAVMHGYTSDELINNSFAALYADDQLKDLNRMRNKLIKDGISFTAELWRKEKDGTVFPTLTTNSIITDDLGKPIFIAITAIDITQRKQLDQEHQRIDKLESVGTLAGGIAHDFNNLLTGIMGNIELARRHVETGNVEKASNRLTEAEKASLQARDLTQQLLTFSRGGAPVKKTVSIAEQLMESATFATRGSNIRCEFSLPDDLWLVDIDKGQMNQVITNLVINADEAMPEGGILNINAMNTVVEEGSSLPLIKGKYVAITIEDQGVGMKKEHLARIFEPYFTTKQKGSGLGLATAYSIIKNHGGYITIESKLGVGTTVYVYLPASRKRLTVEKKEEAVRPSLPARGRILVMDDEEIVREFLLAELTDIGYEVDLTSDGAEAIEMYTKAKETGQPFDAVILDLTVPGGIGGQETIRKLLEIDPDVKAIVSSGYATDPIMSDFRDKGFRAVVVKPYQLGELENMLHDIIAGKDK